jgi:two-component system, chemotaxis family, response regulator Rcp1
MGEETAPRRNRTLLLVDDNADDVMLMRRSLERSKLPVTLHDVQNGLECMNFLRRAGRYASAPRPDLILLDLNMPIMGGREVLAEIVKDDALRALPVVVLTTSNDERDRSDMYRLRCSSYVRKPVDSEEFEAMVKQLCDYWFGLVEPPHNADEA